MLLLLSMCPYPRSPSISCTKITSNSKGEITANKIDWLATDTVDGRRIKVSILISKNKGYQTVARDALLKFVPKASNSNSNSCLTSSVMRPLNLGHLESAIVFESDSKLSIISSLDFGVSFAFKTPRPSQNYMLSSLLKGAEIFNTCRSVG